MALFDFFKKKKDTTVVTFSYKRPVVKIPKQYDKLYSLSILLERERLPEETRKNILSDSHPFFKAKQNFMTIKKGFMSSWEVEQYIRFSKLIRLYTIERAATSAVIAGFFECMIAQMCHYSTWNAETGKPNDKSMFKNFCNAISSTNNELIIQAYEKPIIACFADAILRSGKSIEEVVALVDEFVSYNCGRKTLDGSFCSGVGKDKTISYMKNSIRAFFEDEKPYSLSFLLLMPKDKDTASVENEKPLFELGKEIICNEKGKSYLATDKDRAFIESLYPEIDSILKTAHEEIKGFPRFSTRDSHFVWEKTSDLFNPSSIRLSSCTKTGKTPKYPYVVYIHENDESPTLAQIHISLSKEGKIRRLEYWRFKGYDHYRLIATESKDKTLTISNAYKKRI